jgi:hypothetical protein
MNVTCSNRDRIFQDGTPEDWAALENHAASCAVCAEEIHSWKSLSVAAQELRDYADTPSLWPRIQRSLAEQSILETQHSAGWRRRSFWLSSPLLWQTAAAAAFVLILAIGGLLYLRPPRPAAPGQPDLLKAKALSDVERAETTYVQAIDGLAAQANPELDNPPTPLLASYREKLLVLDSAIDDLRAQAGQNPSNAHLRYELLAMYQEKQRTLEEILKEKR